MRFGSYAAPKGHCEWRTWRSPRWKCRGSRRGKCWCATRTTRSTLRSACDSTRPHPPGYLPAFAVGEGLAGLAVGTVLESRLPGIEVGDIVQHARGYRGLAVVDGDSAALGGAGRLARLDPALAPPEVHLGLLGGTGLTAWAGIVLVASAGAGDTVWVSAAAGAVGSVAAQLAKARGCRVVGSAGSPDKVTYLRDVLGLDAAFDYHQGLVVQLREAAPEGVDVYFDNVGGAHLEAALDSLRPFGRVALCGAISGYNGDPPRGPANLFLATAKNLTIRGFRAGAFADRADEARDRTRRTLARRQGQARAVDLRRTRRGASRDRRSAGRSHPRQVRGRRLSGSCWVIDATHDCRYPELISVQREDRRADFQEP